MDGHDDFGGCALVSVITPAFNAGPYLAETIESCLGQTYRHFELLIVDDGSTDDTAEIAAHYAAVDPRVRIFRIPNRGVAAARNVAIEGSRGTLFALLDSDDRWTPTFLEQLVGVLHRCPEADVVTANAINMGGRFDGQPLWPASDEVQPISLLDMIVREDAVNIFAVFRRTLIDRVGGFDVNFRGNEDYHFWLRAAAAQCRFLADFAPRGYYRRRPDSASSDERRMLTGIVRVFQDITPQIPAGPERLALDRQVRRFTKELLMAEARACICAGNPADGLQYLDRISSAERGTALSILLAVSRVWPELLSGSYRTKRALREMRLRLTRRVPVRGTA